MTTATVSLDKGPRPLHIIATDIHRNWANVWYGAVPYLVAMESLNSVSDNYLAESGDYIVRLFLSNATTWRGAEARRIKAELKAML